MADLRTFPSAQAAGEHILTKGTGGTPIRDGHNNPFFYEEGTWTPELQGLTTPGNHTYSFQIGHYVAIGKLVTFVGRMDFSSFDTNAAGNAVVTGLPYQVILNSITFVEPAYISNVSLPANFSQFMFQIEQHRIRLRYLDTAGGPPATIDIGAFQNATTVRLSGTYIKV